MYISVKEALFENPLHFSCGAILIIIVFTKFKIGSFGNLQNETSIGLLALSGVMLALHKYYYEKDKDRKQQIIELVNSFRLVLENEHSKFAKAIQSEFQEIDKFVRFSFKGLSLTDIVNNQSDSSKAQHDYIYKSTKTKNSACNLANVLEQFSMSIFLQNAEHSDDLRLIHSSFVMMCEDIAMFIHIEKQFGQGDTLYNHLIKLYNFWEPGVDKRTFDEKLNSYQQLIRQVN